MRRMLVLSAALHAGPYLPHCGAAPARRARRAGGAAPGHRAAQAGLHGRRSPGHHRHSCRWGHGLANIFAWWPAAVRACSRYVVAAGVRYSTPWCARAHAVVSALGRRRGRRAGLCITRVRPVGGRRRGSRDGLLARGARALLAAALGDCWPAAAREAVFAARRRDGVRRATRQRAAAQQSRYRAEGQLAA